MHDDYSTSKSPESTANTPPGMLSDAHLRMLRDESGIADEVIIERATLAAMGDPKPPPPTMLEVSQQIDALVRGEVA